MRDRVVEYPGRYKMTDTVSGDQYTFDVVRDEGNVAIDGTPYDTEHVLSNTTATSMGLNLDATPNDAFAKLYSEKQPKVMSQTIAEESTVEGCLGALVNDIDSLDSAKQPKILSHTIGGATTVEGCLSSLNSGKQPKTMSQAIGGATTVEGCLAELDGDITSLDSGKQPKTMSQAIGGESTVEGCLSSLNSLKVDKTSPEYTLDTTAAGTVDGDLYAAITALGWQSSVIE